jgi:hypothetical protein
MSDVASRILAEAVNSRRAILGFAGKVTSLAGNPLVNIELPDWLSRAWTVTLSSMRNGDAANPQGLVATAPIDNQIATQLFPGANGILPPERAAYDIDGVYLAVSWGNGFSRERAFVSYPYGGGSFTLHGSQIRVELPGGLQSAGEGVTGEGIPLIGGFATMSERSQAFMPPTLLTGLRTVAHGTPVLAYAPPRAVGYRLWTVTDSDDVPATFANSNVYRVEELIWLAGTPTVLAIDGTNVEPYRGNSNTLDVSGGNAFQRATGDGSDWRHLNPRAIGLRLSASEEADSSIGVEWILDLG